MKEKMIQIFNNTKNGVQKHSPEILAGVGVVGVVASTVMACKATMKLNDILEESKETRNKQRVCPADRPFVNICFVNPTYQNW